MALIKNERGTREIQNAGDLAVFSNDTRLDRRDIANKGTERTVYPGDVELIADRTKEFDYFFWADTKNDYSDNELDEKLDKGFFFVTTDKFDVYRWSEDAEKRVRAGSSFLLARPQELFEEHRKSMQREQDIKTERNSADIHAAADRVGGVQSFETQKGKVIKGKK